jgi:predicted membrane chloride channel (bestrophin family)
LKKVALLKSISETGYNIGFGGKKHFVTYDLYRIFPRLISCVVICIGILQLTNLYKEHVSTNVGDCLSAIIIIVGIIGIVLDLQGDNKDAYEKAGKKLLALFNELRGMYHDVKFAEEHESLISIEVRLKEIQKEADEVSISKQAIGTLIITHFGFFKVMSQVGLLRN